MDEGQLDVGIRKKQVGEWRMDRLYRNVTGQQLFPPEKKIRYAGLADKNEAPRALCLSHSR